MSNISSVKYKNTSLVQPTPKLLAIPKEVRTFILRSAMKTNHILPVKVSNLAKYGYPGRGSKNAFYSLSLTCKQLHEEVPSIFFAENTFELWAHVDIPKMPDPYYRLMTSINLNVVFVFGHLHSFGYIIVKIKIRSPSITVSVDNSAWEVTEGLRSMSGESHLGKKALACVNESAPILKNLYKALRSGHGIGFVPMKEAQRMLDLISYS